jgi:hypothetical protein
MSLTLFVAFVSLVSAEDSLSSREPYIQAALAVLRDPAVLNFLVSAEGRPASLELMIVDSLFTLDRFPFDTVLGDSVVSVYKADVLRPLRSFPAPWLAGITHATRPAGVLYLARREGDDIVGELFPFDSACRSYEDYTISSNSLKYLLHIIPRKSIQIVRRVRLLR